MRITYYGHSCFAAEIKGKHLLFDPFIAENPLAKAVDIKKLKADYIFVSHAHFDHIADGVTIANQTGATVISNYEIITTREKAEEDSSASRDRFLLARLANPTTRRVAERDYCAGGS